MTESEQNTPHNDFEEFINRSKGKGILTDGPLSKMYTDALNELYAKEVDERSGIAVETQALDEQVVSNLWIAQRDQGHNYANHGEEVGMLYGVAKQEAELKDVENVAVAFSQMTDEQKRNSSVVIDNAVTLDNSGGYDVGSAKFNPYEAALEALCIAHGVPVHNNLQAYIGATARKIHEH